MKDIVRLLPDVVANQIAAGEVVQRPASVVKELLENAIDAGATEIELVTKDGGSSLIQVRDNGQGMSPNDARMALERHATSKITSADDLFKLSTMGFRGEALPSIASVAQVEIKTKPPSDMLGTLVFCESSKVKKQESCAVPDGTTVSVRNLFYNVPARRKFLKSNQVENRNIIQVFERVAMAFPQIRFNYVLEGKELFRMERTTLKQRIVNLLGKNFNERLVPIAEESTIVNLSGFIGKPEFARKIRGEQFFFVNRRFIRHPYLHSAVQDAMTNLLPDGYHPSYFIFLEVDPSTLDVNIHPTKTEVKFEDERSVYAILRSALRKALGEHSITPSIDFDREPSFDTPSPKSIPTIPQIKVNPEYNPFYPDGGHKPLSQKARWETLAPSLDDIPDLDSISPLQTTVFSGVDGDTQSDTAHRKIFQMFGRYIVSTIKSGLMLIDQHRAHQRILFEQFLAALAQQKGQSQQTLFPENVELTPEQSAAAQELMTDLRLLGFDLEHFGGNAFVIRGIPAETTKKIPGELLIETLDQFLINAQELTLGTQVNLAYSLSRKGAIKGGTILSEREMNELLDRLFACESPGYSPVGKPVISTIDAQELKKRFE